MVRVILSISVLLVSTCALASAAAPTVRTMRVPSGGVQPQVAVDAHGAVHMIYLTGDPQAADIQYIGMPAGRGNFGEPVRVNAHPGSALAIGTIRGPHLALGRDGIVHVAWMGSAKAEPKAPGKQAPMLYTRLARDGTFEPERNVITKFVGLDGGGTVAADRDGNVSVAWHAPATPKGDESTRRVFVARSTDDGATFAPEVPLSDESL